MNRTPRRTAVVACLVTVATGAAAATASAAEPPCRSLARFSPLNFPETPAITSTRFPLQPGAQRILEGRSNVGGRPLPHQVTFTVTDLTKVIAGVRTVVVHDVDYSNGQLAEQELSFWAQDNQGNVWNLGEYPEEYLNGQLMGAPATWIADLDGAVPGIHMPARLPDIGEEPYLQGSVPKIHFLDCAETFRVATLSCVPVGCFNGVVITDETSPLDPDGGVQRKSYAPGVGIVEVGFVDDPQGEKLVLTQNSRLSNEALDAVDAAVLEMDGRGPGVNPTYRRSRPIEQRLRPPAPLAAPPAVAEEPLAPLQQAVGRVSLSLRPGASRVSRSGEASVRVLCSTSPNAMTIRPGACRGRLDLYVRPTGARVGTASFTVVGGWHRTVRVRLTDRALRLVRRRGRATVVARTRGALAGSRSVSATISLTLRAPR